MSPDTTEQLAGLLQETGMVSADEMAKALDRSQETDASLVQALLDAGILSCQALEEMLLQFASHLPPVLAVAAVQTPPGNIPVEEADAPERTFDEYKIDDQQLQTILLDRGHVTLQQLTTAFGEQQHTGHPLWRTLINLRLLTPQEMLEVIQTAGKIVTPQQTVPVAADHPPPANQGSLSQPARSPWHTLEVGSNPSAVELVDAIFTGALKTHATDIHIEPQLPCMRVRYRIDGMLFDVMTVPPELEMPIISRIKVLADMDITERRMAQDGHLSTHIGEHECHMRVATLPTIYGEKLVLRLLSPGNVLTGLKQLGLEPDDEHRLRQLIAKRQGMILVTGPIGSGKTTTLYAALNEVNILTNNIITVEDPVEYQLAGINQVEVDPKIGLTFASGLRAILRQDADILMVGEIRDTETAAVAVRAALTGQQLFCTLHTLDAPSAITTLTHFGIQSYLIASALSAVVAERLVRRVCLACKEWYTPSPTILRQLGLDPTQREYTFAYGHGCEACYFTGYSGRTGIFEILGVSDHIKGFITNQASEQEVQTAAVEEGMCPLAQNGIRKILQGVTTPQEVMREVYL